MKNKQKHAAHFLFIFHLFQNERIAYETKSETKRSDKRSDRFFRMLRFPRNEVWNVRFVFKKSDSGDKAKMIE